MTNSEVASNVNSIIRNYLYAVWDEECEERPSLSSDTYFQGILAVSRYAHVFGYTVYIGFTDKFRDYDDELPCGCSVNCEEFPIDLEAEYESWAGSRKRFR